MGRPIDDILGNAQSAPRPAARAATAAPLVAVALLLYTALWFNGAYALTDWGPVAVITLAAVAVVGLRVPRRSPALVLALGLWVFAAWTLISAAWSTSAEQGVEAGAREVFYAGLVTLTLTSLPERRTALTVGRGALWALVAIPALTLAATLADGPAMYLAGRLDQPGGYRNAAAAIMAMATVAAVCKAAAMETPLLLRGLAFAGAIAAVGLAYATQSRGVLLGLTAGLAVAVCLGPDRVRRAWTAIGAAVAVAIVHDDLLASYQRFLADATNDAAAIHRGMTGLLVVVVAGGVVMLALAALDRGLRINADMRRSAARVGALLLVLVAVAGSIAALARIGDPIEFAGDKVREFKGTTVATPGPTRLGSIGGQRYDLWSIAWRQFEHAPLVGAGGGAFASDYYRYRRTDRNLSNPHSLPLRILAESGIAGFAGFFAALLAALVAILRPWRELPRDVRSTGSALAGAAVVVLVQSTIDWLWLIPGVTGLALIALSLAVRLATPDAGAVTPAAVRHAVRAAAALAALAVIVLCGSVIYVREARSLPADDPAGRLSAARSAKRLNPVALTPRLLVAGAEEELGRVREARHELEEAQRLEPENHVPMALLGDFELRQGRPGAARAWYRRALARNPRDTGLQRLAAN